MVTYAEMYNLNPSDYYNINLNEFELSVRTINGLTWANIMTVENLLEKTPDDISSLRNIGWKCLDEIERFLKLISKNGIHDEKQEFENAKRKIFIENCEEFRRGNFLTTQNMTDVEQEALELYKQLYSDLDSGLIEAAYNLDRNVFRIINMLDQFVCTTNKKHKLKEIIKCLPAEVTKVPIQDLIKPLKGSNKLIDMEEMSLDEAVSISKYIDCLSEIPIVKIYDLERILEWWQFDIKEDLQKFFDEIYKKQNREIVLNMRANGYTLEVIGNQLGVTRERVRQIEKSIRHKFMKWNQKYKILYKISILRDGDYVLTRSELEEFFEDKTSELIFLLSDLKTEYIYDRRLDIFVAGEDGITTRCKMFLDDMPDVFQVSKLQGFLNSAEYEWDLPEEAVSVGIKEEYKLSGDVYHRVKFSLSAMYKETLHRFYSSGIRVYDFEEIKSFKEKVVGIFGEVELPKNERALAARIIDLCILCDKGMYMPRKKDYLPEDLLIRIYDFICNGENSIYLSHTIFSVFEDELKIYGVDNRYFLYGILKEYYSDEFVFSRDYISKDKNVTTIHSEIIEFIKKSDYPVSKLEVQTKFPGMTDILMSFATADADILNYFGEYLHSSRLAITINEKEKIKFMLEEILSDGNAHHAKEILETLDFEMSEVLGRNSITMQYRLFSVLEYLFFTKFKFSRPYISKIDVDINHPWDVLHEQIYSEDEFLVAKIGLFARENRIQINSILEYLNSCNDGYMIMNAQKIVSINNTGITEKIAQTIEEIIFENIKSTIPINELSCIAEFPEIKIKWTEWLIYSCIKKWGCILEVGVTSNVFKKAKPLIAILGELDETKFRNKENLSEEELYVPDDLSDIDNLISDYLEMDLLEEEYEL